MGLDIAADRKDKKRVAVRSTKNKSGAAKKLFKNVGNIAIFLLLAIVVYGFSSNLGMNIFVFIFLFVIPFPLNYYLAVTRRKNLLLMLILTLVFSWMVTLILAFMPAEK